jgi:hypothetical protein
MANGQQPHIIDYNANGKIIRLCSECNSPVPAPYASQGPDNMIWRVLACPACGTVFSREGPFTSMAAANPRQFR